MFRRYHHRLLVSLCIAILCASLAPAATTREAVGKTDKPVLDEDTSFSFVIVGDRTGGERPGVFEKAVEKINLLRPAFVMSVGDLIEGYTEDHEQLHREFDEFDTLVDRLDMRFYYVAGNHDASNPAMERMWVSRYGSAHYSFTHKDALFVVLYSEDGGPNRISEEQEQWLARTLDEHSEAAWTFVFLHKPLFAMDNDAWDRIEDRLADRPHTVFAGHWHSYGHYRRDGRDYIRLATTGGASDLNGPAVGQLDHITWVAFDGTAPRIVNLALDGLLPADFIDGDLQSQAYRLARAVRAEDEPIAPPPAGVTRTVRAIRLRNRADRPVHVELTGAEHPEFLLETPRESFTMAPGDERDIAIYLSPADGQAREHSDEVPPIQLRWVSHVTLDDEREVSMKGGAEIRVQSTHRLDATTAEETVSSPAMSD